MIRDTEDERQSRRASAAGSIPVAGILNANASSFPRLDVDGVTKRVEALEGELERERNRTTDLELRLSNLEHFVQALTVGKETS